MALYNFWGGVVVPVLTLLFAVMELSPAGADEFPLSIIHINDFHARFEPTDIYGGTCEGEEVCIGGYARTVYTVKQLLESQKDSNAIYLNAGDSFQGTLWYNIGRWNVTSQFLNMLPADAMTLGNHEFDHGIAGLVPFLETINTTMLVANMNAEHESDMIGKYQKSTIIERSDRKIGLIGVILETTYDLADTGKMQFTNESDAIREEAAKLKSAGANIIIVISHCGYEVDKEIARVVGSEIDVIVGAHSHTFLFTGDELPGPDEPLGDYPTEVVHESGHRVLIVQASAYARYVGNITVFFDDNGDVVRFEGAPIYMANSIPEDAEIKAALIPWKEVIDAQGTVIVGETRVDLLKTPCGSDECNLGNFFCDAIIYAFANLAPYDDPNWTEVAIALVNTGALRVPLSQGNLTYSHLVTMSPFENKIAQFSIEGKYLLEAFEFSVEPIDLEKNLTSSAVFLQVSGLKITYNITKPVGQRVVDVKVRCAACPIPKYEEFDPEKKYNVIAPNFLAQGGDGFHMFDEHFTNYKEKMTDLDALLEYTTATSPIYTGVEDRITVLRS